MALHSCRCTRFSLIQKISERFIFEPLLLTTIMKKLRNNFFRKAKRLYECTLEAKSRQTKKATLQYKKQQHEGWRATFPLHQNSSKGCLTSNVSQHCDSKSLTGQSLTWSFLEILYYTFGWSTSADHKMTITYQLFKIRKFDCHQDLSSFITTSHHKKHGT